MANTPVTKILIFAANPQNTERRRLDEEVREIQAGLRRAKGRDQFEMVACWAVRPDDWRRALLDHNPQIVHFSGHGASETGLVLEDDQGQARPVSAEALARLFELFQDKVSCVLLNACYSEVQAEAIYQHIDYVIGMNQAIGERAAIKFAIGFYDALGAGRSLEDAFKFGCNAVEFEDVVQRLIPVLKCRNHPAEPQSVPLTVQVEQLVETAIGLENPEGQVPLGSPFYVERPPIEPDCYAAIIKPGALIRIKAARQMGKTSLMTRILDHAKQQGCRSVPLYLQEADGEVFASLDPFLQWFCALITEELNLPDQVMEFWQRGAVGSKRKCTNYVQQRLWGDGTEAKAVDSTSGLGDRVGDDHAARDT